MADVEVIPFGNKRSPKQVLLECVPNADKWKTVVVIALTNDDIIETGWSDSSMLKRLGLMDVAKIQMFEAAQE